MTAIQAQMKTENNRSMFFPLESFTGCSYCGTNARRPSATEAQELTKNHARWWVAIEHEIQSNLKSSSVGDILDFLPLISVVRQNSQLPPNVQDTQFPGRSALVPSKDRTSGIRSAESVDLKSETFRSYKGCSTGA